MHLTESQITEVLDIFKSLVVTFGVIVSATASFLSWKQSKSNARHMQANHAEIKADVKEVKASVENSNQEGSSDGSV